MFVHHHQDGYYTRNRDRAEALSHVASGEMRVVASPRFRQGLRWACPEILPEPGDLRSITHVGLVLMRLVCCR